MRKNKKEHMATQNKTRSMVNEFDVMHDEAEIAQLNSLFEHQKEVDKIAEEMNKPGAVVCRDCDEPISKARRKAVPWAQRCIDCQDVEDRRH
jgi:phage/conjugal plasmid C-4 type zinc finger TraR family protein|tara:strand:- start:1098 stop:1373 length:276 start_codon:yes stop_codon:yes gene_type:complete